MENKTLIVVRALITDHNNKVLLLKRTSNRNYNPDQWELPGGKLLENEDINIAFERIINDETNIVVTDTGRHHFVNNKFVREGKYKGYNYFEITLSTSYVGGTPRFDEKDHCDIIWTSGEKALDLNLSLESKKTIGMYLEKVKSEIPTKVIIVSRAIIFEKDKFLILQRAQSEEFPGQWELPGGKLDQFESLNDHIVREVLEETGLVINIDDPFLTVTSIVPKEGRHKGETVLSIINRASIKAGRLSITNEHQAYKWVTKKECFDYNLAEYIKLPLTEIFLPRQ